MSKSAELHNIFYSFSGDSTLTTHNRSGDSTGDGVERWNFIGSVQSAEADIIDEEERTEQREAKRKFAQLLGLYFKKILAPGEFKFLAACMCDDKTPYAIGRSLGVDYEATIAAINAKHKANLPKLLQLMRTVGYENRRGLVFLPKLNYYIKRNAQKRAAAITYARRHPELKRERYKVWREANRERQAEYNREYRRTRSDELREAENARKREQRAANREAINARARERYQANIEANREASRKRYSGRTPEQRQKNTEAQRRRHESNREAYNEYQRRYRAEHHEQYREYERRKAARKSFTPEQLEADRAKARERSAKRYAAKREEILMKQRARRQQQIAQESAEA